MTNQERHSITFFLHRGLTKSTYRWTSQVCLKRKWDGSHSGSGGLVSDVCVWLGKIWETLSHGFLQYFYSKLSKKKQPSSFNYSCQYNGYLLIPLIALFHLVELQYTPDISARQFRLLLIWICFLCKKRVQVRNVQDVYFPANVICVGGLLRQLYDDLFWMSRILLG